MAKHHELTSSGAVPTIPPGGEKGDQLVKSSDESFDTEWRKPSGGDSGTKTITIEQVLSQVKSFFLTKDGVIKDNLIAKNIAT